MDGERRIADVDDLSTDDTLLFRVLDGDEVKEAILVLLAPGDDAESRPEGDRCGDSDGNGDGDRDGDGTAGSPASERVVCWLNYCQHFTHITLDKGSGAPRRNGELVCANHGAMFDAGTGECTHGPCEGAFLTEVCVTVAGDGVYLDDDGYEYVGPGGIESDPTDLTSTSNVEF